MIDVVIPAFNAGRFLRDTVYSVAAQTQPPDCMTIVDDASTDDTVAVASACADELAGRLTIRVLKNRGLRGPSGARNTGISQSTATWIALLDADDILAPCHHAVLLRSVAAADDVVLGFGDSSVFHQQHTLVPSYLAVSGIGDQAATEIAPGAWTLGDKMFSALLHHGVFGTSACLFRRDVACAVGLFDESMMQSEDTDFFIRLALAGRFAFSREVIMHKRVHDANLSHARHKLAFCRGTARSLAKIGKLPNLSAAQSVALQQASSQALEDYLYSASRTGVSSYWQAASFAHQSQRTLRAGNLRHLARLAWCRIL